MKKTIFGVIMCTALCACTSEDMDLVVDNNNVFQGDKAYITVKLCDVGTNAATRAKDSGFESSITGEYEVNDAYFYFFDADGVFVSQGEVWKGGLISSDKDNVDFSTDTQVILKGLAEKNYPKYVVTVLNRPEWFKAGETLAEFEKLLSGGDASGIKSGNNFVMSTTSFANQISADNSNVKIPYFVTELSEKNFHLEPITDLSKVEPVDIYVERLAAKVTLSVLDRMQDKATQAIDEGGITHFLYEVDETVAGDENTDDEDGMAVDKLYVELLGWKLNATARNSYMVKNINEEWKNSSQEVEYNLGPEWTWNDPANKRSYWCKSYNYDVKYDYKSNSLGNTEENENDEKIWLNDYLKYVCLKGTKDSPLLSLGSHDYCAENTNTAQNSSNSNTILKYKNSPAITSILVKAQICKLGEDGKIKENPTLVRYKGELFTEKGYLDYVIKHLILTRSLNAYYVDKEGAYSHIDNLFLELKKLRAVSGYQGTTANIDGFYAVVPNNLFNETTLYKKTDNGTYEAIDDTSSLTALFDEFNEDADAMGYANGLMYYNIPIEHINNNYKYQDNGDDMPQTQILNEGNYGVVRNNHYYVNIVSLKTLGKGIVDENEVIVPDPRDYLDTYYVGAEIKVLPWKVVVQDIEI